MAFSSICPSAEALLVLLNPMSLKRPTDSYLWLGPTTEPQLFRQLRTIGKDVIDQRRLPLEDIGTALLCWNRVRHARRWCLSLQVVVLNPQGNLRHAALDSPLIDTMARDNLGRLRNGSRSTSRRG